MLRMYLNEITQILQLSNYLEDSQEETRNHVGDSPLPSISILVAGTSSTEKDLPCPKLLSFFSAFLGQCRYQSCNSDLKISLAVNRKKKNFYLDLNSNGIG